MSKWSGGFIGGVAVALAVAIYCASDGPKNVPTSVQGASAALVALGLLMGAWFLKSFVFTALPSRGDDRDKALTDIYAFAYTFTLLGLATLALPFGNLLNERSFPDTGPVRLLRGCVVEPPPESKGENKATLDSLAIPKADGSAPKEVKIAPPAAAVATDAGASGAVKEKVPLAGPDAKTRSADTAASAASKNDWPKGLPVCGTNAEDVYTVLVTIGGVVAHMAPTVSGAPASGALAPPPRNAASVYEVRAGFVVPAVMVVLAIIGAVVNLMRRVPEFQKRAHVDFVGTDKEPPLQPCEAREFVAFQILQLIAAPFLAMVALYVIAPQSLPSAIALSFVSGLFSEGVLLRIRALVEGPEKTQTQAAAQALGELEISVKSGGSPVQGALVSIAQPVSGKKVSDAVTDALGLVVLKAVPPGRLRIIVTEASPGIRKSTPVDIDLSSGQRQHVDVTL